ncbi:MAG: hypothetical protein C0518_05125 [Opitutus sp.]|nr:hypothetical protein [Opitutus sp.]
MTDPATGTTGTSPPETPDAPASADSVLPAAETGCALVPGRRWRNYQIGEPNPVQGPGAFDATDALSMEPVVVCARQLGSSAEARRETWQLLENLPAGNLVPLRESHEEEGWRYEVTSVPGGSPLRDWIACHQVGVAEIETIVRQLTLLLEAMHAAGVVHLRLRPDAIFVNEAERNLEVMLGGLGAATLHSPASPELMPLEVDPYYSPPEAAGLFRHKPGPELCAWDWWSLGRVVQEMIHGRHVYGLLFERDVSGQPPELHARAENALLDRDPSAVRAGAVELLPDGTNPRLRILLRGLLASSRDGRWGSDQVLRWLQREHSPDRYDLPRDARLFVWRRRAFTVPEAAEFFLQPDYALEGQAQLFPGAQSSGTMLGFLRAMPQLKAECERVTQVLALVETPAWRTVPLNARRSAVAGLAWLTLAPSSTRPPLSVQRWRVDPSGLQEMLSDAPPAEALALAQALTTGVYRCAVEALDANAGRTLALLADAGFKAVREAEEAGWMGPADPGAQVRVLRFALESDKDLVARRDRLRMSYATNANARLATLFAADNPERASLTLLAFTGERAKDFGYITHAEWAQGRFVELRARATRVAAAIFWRRLRRVVVASPALLGPWPVFAAVWAVPLAYCVAGEAWMAAGLTAVFAVALRGGSHAWINRLAARLAPGAAPWTWTTRSARCAGEATRSLHAIEPPPAEPWPAEFQRLRREIGTLRLSSRPELPLRAPSLVEFWVASFVSAVAPVAVVVAMLVTAQRVPPAPTLVDRPATLTPTLAADAAELAAAQQLFEEFNDGFGRRPRGPLKAWDVPAVAPQPLAVRRMTASSPLQRAYAKVGAELLLDVYPRHGLEVTVAVPVPAGPEAGLVLYDSGARELVDARTFFVGAPLANRTWYWIGNRRVVYLGVPERLAAQISLAPP